MPVLNGIDLQGDIKLLENKIEEMVLKKEYTFNVYEKNGKGYVETEICQCRGCMTNWVIYETFEEAERFAALLTLFGSRVRMTGTCHYCSQ